MWKVRIKAKPVFRDSPATVQEPDIVLVAGDWTSACRLLDYIDPQYLGQVTIKIEEPE